MNSSTPASFLKFLTQCGRASEKLARYRIRGMVVISGSNPVKMASLTYRLIYYYIKKWRRMIKDKKEFTGLYIYHDEFDDAVSMRNEFEKQVGKLKSIDFQFTVYEKSDKYLGTTVSILVMDLTRDLKPNDLGRLIGIVEGGGLIVLLTPPWDKWDEFKTIFKMNLTVPQYPEPRHVFIKWVKKHLLEFDGIGIYDADNNRIIKRLELRNEYKPYERKIDIPKNTLFPSGVYEHALTMDQVNVLKIIEEFYEKPPPGKKKVLVLTADRGRGKSCAVGIGAVGLIHLLRKVKPKPRVLVTAPEPSNIQSLMMLAMKVLDKLGYKYDVIKRDGNVIELRSDRFSIEYWEPLNIPKINGDIVIVDEAAGIHVPLLYKILESHKRIIFSSTIHGYEGAGRGFSVRFLKRIKNSKDIILYEYEMTEPIRYNYDDPIENWQFKTLLLDAEPAELSEEDLKDIESGNLMYVEYAPEELFNNEDELRQLFGIYVLAHYRNEPDDLGMIADAPHHLVRAAKTRNGKIVCAVQIAYEGPIDEATATELLKGSKIPGNIIPDRFLKHLRYVDFAKTKGWRIVRIATHPAVQGRGIGSWILNRIREEAVRLGLDWIGSGFGVNEQLLRFWLRNGFIPVHISPDRNPVSGEYTILVIQPISEVARRLVEKAAGEFKSKILNSIPVNYREMEPEIALLILDSEPYVYRDKPIYMFTPVAIDRLWTYCQGPMTFEAAADIMFKIARIHWLLHPDVRPKLTRLQEIVLLTKSLQALTWDEVHEITRVPVKELQKEGHEIACIYFNYLTSLEPDKYVPGVRDYMYEFHESNI
ncbi:MAG: tRNA(Met) cytidine acetyltransferase TmcA [Desulfurococcus sp.]|uniref:tRNA(Met) cytidine acetyltransferase TmcA n=1 Tax=Desulfurococcus sp. TaxID=51678 RepID=UPI00316A1EDA